MINGQTFQVPSTTCAVLREQLRAAYTAETVQLSSVYLSAEHEACMRPLLEQMIEPLGVVQTHLSIKSKKSPIMPGGRWMSPFPHIHKWDDSVTIILYVQSPEGGGEFVWDDGEEHIVEVEEGLAVACDGQTQHGVLRITGDKDRMAILTTGWKVGSAPAHFVEQNAKKAHRYAIS